MHIQCTLQQTFSTHCSQSPVHTAVNLQCTLQLYYPVHTAANLQCTLQLYHPVHTAANLQCTLQLYHPVHTAATLSGFNTIQYIQCTFESPQGKPIPLMAYLQNSQQTLMVDCSSPYDEEDCLFVAVPMMKKTG